MFGTEAQTELGDLKVVATKSGGRMKYIDRSADWHEADMPTVFRDVRFQGQSGKHLLTLSFSGFDPDVWSGRALQVDFAELAVSGLASMYPAFDWSVQPSRLEVFNCR
jgi:hypothetical protein